ncbi:enoyl-CoA hydratase [Thecamonas trahens ATCC 50062]|uniref:Enoyl-CoA hydratase n=1 Tax=Thecamonas trahens ATCC 50062 TaxID=461836 RepID=A0A0L0DKA5_THETB|nr:enoyl-CoA hydratase [Thecamonas trahens ATCC 50062]KNC52625.1 enoyl-CoA hydratase [Thecamonas trahens ATCC 50062]|eukprot:XP_013755181.1 enoyl-CoA hydratase [Thecamonas trahens ATCC 50062]
MFVARTAIAAARAGAGPSVGVVGASVVGGVSRPLVATLFSAAQSSYEHIVASVEREGTVGLVRLNRPKALNALCSPLFEELNEALANFDADPKIGAMVVTGSDKAFAAGADISEMADKEFAGVFAGKFLSSWDAITKLTKPVIAAVNGFALGGGCELAMMCDFIIAGDKAQFGQPEIKLGTIPGAGGTQRLTKAIGKSKAMDLCLTGDFMDVHEAKSYGLVARIVPADELVDSSLDTAAKIAGYSQIANAMVRLSTPRSRPHSPRACTWRSASSTPPLPPPTRRRA